MIERLVGQTSLQLMAQITMNFSADIHALRMNISYRAGCHEFRARLQTLLILIHDFLAQLPTAKFEDWLNDATGLQFTTLYDLLIC